MASMVKEAGVCVEPAVVGEIDMDEIVYVDVCIEYIPKFFSAIPRSTVLTSLRLYVSGGWKRCIWYSI